MKFLEDITKKPKIFQRTVGLEIEQFEKMLLNLEPIWNESEAKRKNSKERKREVGGGRTSKILPLKEKLLIILIYYKTYMTQELLGCLIMLDQSNVSRLIKKMSLLIEQVADPELATYLSKAKEEYMKLDPQQRINDWAAFVNKFPDLQSVSTDATEQQCHRSKDNETQKEHYSGKKKVHSLKTQISVSKTGRILNVSRTYPGKVHDKKIIDQENTIEKFPEKTCHRFDAGYQAVVAEHPKYYLVTPHKKPKKQELSNLAKELNVVNSKCRVIVENVISRIKKFKICKYIYRGELVNYNQTFRNIAALVNFKLANSIVII